MEEELKKANFTGILENTDHQPFALWWPLGVFIE